jgi:rare lipoprotein A
VRRVNRRSQCAASRTSSIETATLAITIWPLVVLVALAAGCSAVRPVPPPPEPGQVGVASWYGAWHHGRTTASGERFDQRQLTAAHRSLPFGTRARVINLANGRSVVVRINDRGPFARGRVIDLSYAAASALGMVRRGTARVRIEVLAGRRLP